MPKWRQWTNQKSLTFLTLLAVLLCGCGGKDNPTGPKAYITDVKVGGLSVPYNGTAGGVDPQSADIVIYFSKQPSTEKDVSAVTFSGGPVKARIGDESNSIVLTPVDPLEYFKAYSFSFSEGDAFGLDIKDDYRFTINTMYDPVDKFEKISDEDLLTLVQQKTFSYFWDYAHPGCGLARERLGSGNTVTTGGSGFGIMCLPVGVERGFITREEASARMRTILDFLENKAQRFHGAYPHWIDGDSGKVQPFGENDNGGDLVETAFLIQGLLAVKEYFDNSSEADIRASIERIWQGVEWDWYTRGGQNVLYWHWSPDKGWAMNMKIQGWNEALMTYLLAVSSPTHPASTQVYDSGWARGGKMSLATDGPLFFAHYSFLGLDPRGLKDKYGSYWEHNVAHALVNYRHCVKNPGNHTGYGPDCWGLTASDVPGGYAASSASNDKGTIAPTAALASIPYTPEESMAALRTFYYKYGDRLFGKYGFYDAFCMDRRWFATSYIAIDQGPIVVMIENYRTGLLWDLFMKNEDIKNGLTRLEFQTGE